MSQAGSGFEAEVERVARRPQRGWRSPLLMAVVAGLSLWLAWGFHGEVAYFFADDTPVDLGKAYEVPPGLENTYVRIDEGLPSRMVAGYEQFGRQYRVFFLLGTRTFVREPAEDAATFGGDTGEYPVFEGAGRLIDLGTAETYGNVRQFFAQRGGWSFGEEPAWLLLAGVRPGEQWQYPLLVGVLLAIAVLNLILLIRRLAGR